jgi:hypothetical protein
MRTGGGPHITRLSERCVTASTSLQLLAQERHGCDVRTSLHNCMCSRKTMNTCVTVINGVSIMRQHKPDDKM